MIKLLIIGLLFSFYQTQASDHNNSDSLYYRAEELYREHEYDSAIYYYEKALNSFADGKVSRSKIYTDLGITQYETIAYNDAIRSLENALDNFQPDNDDSVTLIRAYHGLANIYRRTARYEDATKQELLSRDIARVIRNLEGQVKSWNGLAIISFYQKDYDQAIYFSKQALRIIKSENNVTLVRDLITITANIGLYHKGNQNYDSAIFYYKKANNLSLMKTGEPYLGSYSNLGVLFGVTSQLDSSIFYLTKTLEIAKELKDTTRIIRTSINLSQSFLKQNRFVKSENILMSLLPTIEKNKLYEELMTAYSILFKADSLEGKYLQATNWLKKYYQASDSILSQSKNRELSELRIKYETAEKEKEILENPTALSYSRKLLVFSSVALLIFLALSVYLYLLFQKNKKLRDLNANLVREQNHRVKNNLQMLASMIAVQAEKVEDETVRQSLLDNEKCIQSLALLHRRLYDREYINVDVHEYFHELLEELLFSLSAQGVELKLGVEKVTLPVDTMVHLGLITNELVTNSVKHGFNSKPEKPEISLDFYKSAKGFEMIYQDNGRGINGATKNGFGTDLIKSQVKQLHGKYVIHNESGYKFIMSF